MKKEKKSHTYQVPTIVINLSGILRALRGYRLVLPGVLDTGESVWLTEPVLSFESVMSLLIVSVLLLLNVLVVSLSIELWSNERVLGHHLRVQVVIFTCQNNILLSITLS